MSEEAAIVGSIGGLLTFVWALLMLLNANSTARAAARTAAANERLLAIAEWQLQQRQGNGPPR